MPLCVVIPWDSEEARQWEHRTGSLVPRTGMVASQRMVLEDSEVCGGEAHCSENQHKTLGVAFSCVCLPLQGPIKNGQTGGWRAGSASA